MAPGNEPNRTNLEEKEMLIRYEPLSTLRHIHAEMDRAFSNTFPVSGGARRHGLAGGWTPAVDIREDGESFVISADLPGVAPGDIEVTMEDGTLTIKGDRKSESRDEKTDGYRRVERMHGSFLRRFDLPEAADTEKVSARGRDGVLEVTIPKKAALAPKRIPILN